MTTELIQISEGHPHTRRVHGRETTVQIDHRWRVERDGKVIGHVEYVNITHETRTPGKRYVNKRWQTPGWRYTDSHEPWSGRHWIQIESRAAAVRHLESWAK